MLLAALPREFDMPDEFSTADEFAADIAEQVARDHAVVLRSRQLELRAFRLDDAEAIYQAVCDSHRELGRWLSWCHDKYCRADTLEFLKARSEALRTGGEHAFAIIERATGQFVGATGVNQLDHATRRANLGYWLRTSATGKGYATTSTILLARWALAELGLERIEIVAAVGNLPSQWVAERVGAVREGVARHRLRVHNVQHDAVVYSLVASDKLPRIE
jgi:ribosomal-protein-serine acetyltransferase